MVLPSPTLMARGFVFRILGFLTSLLATVDNMTLVSLTVL